MVLLKAMAQLILEWLNDEVKLSRRIFSIDHDLRDGYLLGELLFKFNQLDDISAFSSKGTPDAKINNFCLLEPAMRQIGVTFNAKISYDIMHAVHGTIRNLLYELREKLEGIRSSSSRAYANLSGVTKGPNGKILRVVRNGLPLFDRTMATTFENSIRAMMENPNDVLMEKITRKFDEKKMAFRSSVYASHSQGMNSLERELQKRKETHRQTVAHTKDFTDAMGHINVEQWKDNQRIAHERRERELRFERTATQRREQLQYTKRVNQRDLVLTSIDDFENRLGTDIYRDDAGLRETVGKALKKVVIDEPGATLLDTTFIDRRVLHNGLVLEKKTIKERNEDNHVRNISKDRRRRRFLGERDALHRTSLKDAAASQIIDTLLNPSQAEIFEEQYYTRVTLQKDLIVENVNNRESLISQMNDEDDARRIKWEKEEANREYQWVVGHRITAQHKRMCVLDGAHHAADDQRRLEAEQTMTDRMQRVVAWVESCKSFALLETGA